jgi:hypothetical protein
MIWRKTRRQQVDEKVENILEGYRMIDQHVLDKKQVRPKNTTEEEAERQQRINRYF